MATRFCISDLQTSLRPPLHSSEGTHAMTVWSLSWCRRLSHSQCFQNWPRPPRPVIPGNGVCGRVKGLCHLTTSTAGPPLRISFPRMSDFMEIEVSLLWLHRQPSILSSWFLSHRRPVRVILMVLHGPVAVGNLSPLILSDAAQFDRFVSSASVRMNDFVTVAEWWTFCGHLDRRQGWQIGIGRRAHRDSLLSGQCPEG